MSDEFPFPPEEARPSWAGEQFRFDPEQPEPPPNWKSLARPRGDLPPPLSLARQPRQLSDADLRAVRLSFEQAGAGLSSAFEALIPILLEFGRVCATFSTQLSKTMEALEEKPSRPRNDCEAGKCYHIRGEECLLPEPPS